MASTLQQLQINPIVNASHYAYFFDVAINTARRYLKIDKQAQNKERITFQDFWNLYNAFPCPKFKPKWRTVELPQNVKSAA